MNDGGNLHSVVHILRQNAVAAEAEFEAEKPTREGIPLDLWRALPPSPDSIVYLRTYVGPGLDPEIRPWRYGDVPLK
jgi:hypothetical protein